MPYHGCRRRNEWDHGSYILSGRNQAACAKRTRPPDRVVFSFYRASLSHDARIWSQKIPYLLSVLLPESQSTVPGENTEAQTFNINKAEDLRQQYCVAGEQVYRHAIHGQTGTRMPRMPNSNPALSCLEKYPRSWICLIIVADKFPAVGVTTQNSACAKTCICNFCSLHFLQMQSFATFCSQSACQTCIC